MTPIVTLIGRSNVGKSTLFNQLTHTKEALVSDFSGLTRDRKYGYAQWKKYNFIVIDTGGIEFKYTENTMKKFIIEQSIMAITEASIVLFIVDGRSGIMEDDQKIAKYLHISKKTTIIVVNKIDGVNINSIISDFYSLGIKNIHCISASHGRGINSLLKKIFLILMQDFFSKKDIKIEEICKSFMDTKKIEKKECQKIKFFNTLNLPIKIAIVGRPNVGKSTLINRILNEDRVAVYHLPGTTRDSVYIPIIHNKRKYILIDTAGVRKHYKILESIEKFSIMQTLQAIEKSNVVILIIDGCIGISDQDLLLLRFILKNGRSIVIAINKWDSLSTSVRNKVQENLNRRLYFIDLLRIHFISALNGTGIENLFTSVDEAYDNSIRKINTSLLTRIMHMAIDEHQPPLIHGRRIKPKYAHSGGYNPLVIVIHGTQVKRLPDYYKRYLVNYFRRFLKMMGTPIHFQFNETINPYKNQNNPKKFLKINKNL